MLRLNPNFDGIISEVITIFIDEIIFEKIRNNPHKNPNEVIYDFVKVSENQNIK